MSTKIARTSAPMWTFSMIVTSETGELLTEDQAGEVAEVAFFQSIGVDTDYCSAADGLRPWPKGSDTHAHQPARAWRLVFGINRNDEEISSSDAIALLTAIQSEAASLGYHVAAEGNQPRPCPQPAWRTLTAAEAAQMARNSADHLHTASGN